MRWLFCLGTKTIGCYEHVCSPFALIKNPVGNLACPRSSSMFRRSKVLQYRSMTSSGRPNPQVPFMNTPSAQHYLQHIPRSICFKRQRIPAICVCVVQTNHEALMFCQESRHRESPIQSYYVPKTHSNVLMPWLLYHKRK